jgi:hypothetical protein
LTIPSNIDPALILAYRETHYRLLGKRPTALTAAA